MSLLTLSYPNRLAVISQGVMATHAVSFRSVGGGTPKEERAEFVAETSIADGVTQRFPQWVLPLRSQEVSAS